MHLLTLRLCRNISPIPDSLIAMLQWATSHSITGTESVSSAPRRSLCFPAPPGSRCSCPSIREDSRSGGTWATRSSWNGTHWPEASDPNDHPSTPQPTSAGTTSSCPHTTASPALATNASRNLNPFRTSLSYTFLSSLLQSPMNPTCRYPSGSPETQSP